MEYRMRKKFNITGSCNPERKFDARRKVRIHNIIFEEVLNNYFIAEQTLNSLGRFRMQVNYAPGGRLDMEQVITRFAELLDRAQRKKDI